MSTLIEKINKAFTDAYKAKDMELKNTIGTIKGEIEREAPDPKNISDDQASKELKKMIKNHENGKSPLNEMELNFIESILPKQMSDSDIDAKLQELVDGGAKHIGQIMGGFKGLNADMKVVKEKADALLNA